MENKVNEFCNLVRIHGMKINDDMIWKDMIYCPIHNVPPCIFVWSHKHFQYPKQCVTYCAFRNAWHSTKSKSKGVVNVVHYCQNPTQLTYKLCKKFLLHTNMVAIWCNRLSFQHKNSRTTQLKVWKCIDISQALVHSCNVNH